MIPEAGSIRSIGTCGNEAEASKVARLADRRPSSTTLAIQLWRDRSWIDVGGSTGATGIAGMQGRQQEAFALSVDPEALIADAIIHVLGQPSRTSGISPCPVPRRLTYLSHSMQLFLSGGISTAAAEGRILMLLPSSLPRFPRLTWLAPFTLLAGCTGAPEGTRPVTDFQIDHYLGQWYEIARLDHGFEQGLACVTAEYSRRADGGIRVVNRGFDPAAQRWECAEGHASFVGTPDVGHLKVSFFAPFYAGYNVLELDGHYRHALVSGPDHDHLWILSREPTMDTASYESLVSRAREMDFPVDELIAVEQDSSNCPPPDASA